MLIYAYIIDTRIAFLKAYRYFGMSILKHSNASLSIDHFLENKTFLQEYLIHVHVIKNCWKTTR